MSKLDVFKISKDSRIARYLRETRAELRKVVWPSRAETTRLSVIVVSVMVGMSAALGVVDYVFSRLIGLVVR